MNGRCGQDKGRGKLTFKEISVIDYSIVSAHALKFVHDFDINKLDCLFSDGHSLLSTYLKLNISQVTVIKPNKTANKKKPPPRWHEEKKADFLLHIDRNKIMAINNYICELHQNKNVNKNDINQICNDIGSIFAMAAETIPQQTNSSSYKHNAENLNASKPWFGYKCQNARRKYHIARKINNINPSNRNKANLKEASKNYKKVMNFHINKYNQNMQDKLRKLKSTNPKEYWKIINSVNKNKDSDKMDVGTLYEFFKNLNEQCNDGNDDVNINIDISDDDELLNSYITEGEIKKCIKSLKNNKSSANDRIINEYIKNTSDIMLPTYDAFFNLVFDCGIIPDTWLEGIIRPIYKKTAMSKIPKITGP